MQIRPGVTLLETIAKASEPRPVPFAERLSQLDGAAVPGRIAEVQRVKEAPPPEAARPGVTLPVVDPSVAPSVAAAPVKPRGSLLNIVV